jgi:hypothetical protein
MLTVVGFKAMFSKPYIIAYKVFEETSSKTYTLLLIGVIGNQLCNFFKNPYSFYEGISFIAYQNYLLQPHSHRYESEKLTVICATFALG